MKSMRMVVAAIAVAAFSAGLVGCEASARVDPDPDTSVRTSSGSYEKKTTTVREPDGDTKTTTEVNRR